MSHLPPEPLEGPGVESCRARHRRHLTRLEGRQGSARPQGRHTRREAAVARAGAGAGAWDKGSKAGGGAVAEFGDETEVVALLKHRRRERTPAVEAAVQHSEGRWGGGGRDSGATTR